MALFQIGKNSATSVTHLSHAVCECCDLLLNDISIPPHFNLTCPRCNTVVFHNRANSLWREYALVLTGLLLFWPAVYLPILQVTQFARLTDVNILDGVFIFIEQREFIIAFIVFASAILSPFLNLLLLFLSISAIYLDRMINARQIVDPLMEGQQSSRRVLRCGVAFFRWYQAVNPWVMLEVYLIGFLVTMSNVDKVLVNPGAGPGPGFYAFLVVMLTTILSSLLLNSQFVWQCLDKSWKR
ncbi:MAG: hypothetical protein COB51_06550 [Moraxellaceae bacterium]|nr:MAG: hypothetical protein COB51_06550 [Moraxellaceae bacterium]